MCQLSAHLSILVFISRPSDLSRTITGGGGWEVSYIEDIIGFQILFFQSQTQFPINLELSTVNINSEICEMRDTQYFLVMIESLWIACKLLSQPPFIILYTL